VSPRSEKPNEFRRYRQILAAIYFATIALGFVLLAASVAKQLFFKPDIVLQGPAISAENPDPVMLLTCNQKVQSLYDELGQTIAELLAAPAKAAERSLGREWEQFGRSWIHQWHVVDAECRFDELSGSMGEPYDRMAQVHGDLRAMRLKYQSLLVRFDEEQSGELRDMQRALEKSRVALEALVEESAGAASGLDRDGQHH
jgi:hypothetical protein